MTLTLQLTPWALAPLLGLLLAVREIFFFWPRRREPGSPPFLMFTGLAGLWCLLSLATQIHPASEGKILVARIGMAIGAVVPLAWLYFALDHTREERGMRRVPVLLMAAGTLVTVVLSLTPAAGVPDLLAGLEGRAVEGLLRLRLDPGPWYWVHLTIRILAVAMATAILVRYHAARADALKRSSAAVLAATAALLPLGFQLATDLSRTWTNLSPPGFALAASALAIGLLRHRLLTLGPVARTLVMVELRDPLIVLDGRGRIVDANRAAEDTLGLEPYGDVPVALGTLWASSGGRPGIHPDIHLDTRDPDDGAAARRVFDVTLTPLDGGGAPGRSALLLRDVTARERMEQELRDTTRALTTANTELERLANTDGLTGLPNRRHFMEALEREIERALRYERPLSLVLLDLDRFKEVNDTHGHAVGDAVLEATGRVLREISRDIDLPARLGGEEFALLLPETDPEGASQVAERLRQQLAAVRHRPPDGSDFGVTSSLGVATVVGEVRTGEALLQQADDALYRAKEEGRDRVVLAPGAG